MKIVFTQFTPPFEHGMTELEYLKYNDWFSMLRRSLANIDEVAFISFTLQKKLLQMKFDNYMALFFPVKNLRDRQRNGRLWYENDEICPWILKFNPDVIHVIGSGSQMGYKIFQNAGKSLRFLWERCAVNQNTLSWKELDLCDYYVHPTIESIKLATVKVPEEKLLAVPLGADTDFFKPSKTEKQFDVLSVGRLTPSKQIHKVQELVVRRNYSWIHANGFIKKKPYNKAEDIFFFRKLRKFFIKYPIKKSLSGRIWSGKFNHADMPKVYNKAKIMVHPSLAEGAARAVQEALCCQLPVVVLKKAVPWVKPEFGIAMEDISQLDEAVRSLLSNNEKLKKMGENGRDWLLNNHSFSHLFDTVCRFNRLGKISE